MALATALVAGCGASGPSSSEVGKVIATRIAGKQSPATVGGERLIERRAVGRFYSTRGSKPAWDRRDLDEILEAIRGVAQDGLDPKDYHLAAIEAIAKEPKRTAETQADLDLLLTDAVAAVVDHIHYGRVRPSSVNAEWNVDPRDDAPPLDSTVVTIAAAPSAKRAIESQRPDHFIYRGLMASLASLDGIAARGGWPTVRSGKTLKPGDSDPRVPAIRARLAVEEEAKTSSPRDSLRYDGPLREAVLRFKAHHRLAEDDKIDAATLAAMNVPAGARAAQVRVNLERARWVLGGLGDDFVLVNLPAFKAYRIQNGKNVWEARTQIGEEAMKTPTFRASIRTVVFNPDWTVPPTILAEEVLTGMRENEDYLSSKGLVVYDADGQAVDPGSIDWGSATPENFHYTLRQPASNDNALGRVKFLFPNKYSIYLHDTPSRHLFDATQRTFSHGCIRLENPLELAENLLAGQDSWNPTKIEQVVASGETKNVAVEHPIPIIIVYWTVSVGASGEVRYAPDIYSLDPPLLAALDAPPRAA